eukprot:8592284-Pyramimonas_sp.AAC.1
MSTLREAERLVCPGQPPGDEDAWPPQAAQRHGAPAAGRAGRQAGQLDAGATGSRRGWTRPLALDLH